MIEIEGTILFSSPPYFLAHQSSSFLTHQSSSLVFVVVINFLRKYGQFNVLEKNVIQNKCD